MPHRTPHGLGKRLARVLRPLHTQGRLTVAVRSASTHAGAIRPGDAYFAVVSAGADGHEDAALAADRGASLIVTERLLPLTTPQCVVRDAGAAFARFCMEAVGNPAAATPVVAVAGAHGKTTVATLLRGAYAASGRRVATLRNPTPQITPPAFARWLAEHAADLADVAVVEHSTAALASRSLSGVKPVAVCLLNLSGSDAERLQAEGLLRRAGRGATVVVPAADEACRGLAERVGRRTVTFGLGVDADVRGDLLGCGPGDATLLVTVGGDTLAVDLPLAGPTHALNCLAAIATAVATGVEPHEAARGVESVDRVRGVLEPVTLGQPFRVLLDSANTPRRVRATLLGALPAPGAGRLIVVLTGHGNVGRGPMLAATASRADLIITDRPSAGPAGPGCDLRVVEDAFTAAALAVALAEPGDTVVVLGALAGSSCDREAVEQLIALRLANSPEASPL